MANGGQIKYSIGFNVQQTELNRLKSTLQELQRMTVKDFARINFDTKDAEGDLAKVKESVKELQNALNKSTNLDLGTVNLAKFNKELKDMDLKSIYQNLSLAGTAGTSAFRNLTTGILQTNVQIKQSNKLLDDMANTLKNTAKWTAASSVMNSFANSVQQAYGYVKHLDSSLNDIRIVTGYSADEMDRFAEKANKAAKNLAASTTDYTEASLIYYQQGLSGEEVEKRAETTLKAANVTGQDAAAVSEQLTAVWNGYKVSAQETEMYVDKLAAVAASTASDLEELSVGMSKVASAAAASGVDMDQLSATLSTVISVTRQAPETVGTAFKTIYARLGDLAVDGEDEFGTKLGEVSSKLQTMGIEILDSQGQMREMGTVVEEVAAKWDTWSSAQKQAAAVAMAGKRQYNNLIALFDNWDMYESSLQTSQNSLGTLSEQQEIYLDSAEAKLQQLKTSQEGLYDSLLDADTIKEVASLLTGLVTGLEHVVDSIGGGSTVLLGLGAAFTKVFNKQLTSSLVTTATNFKTMNQNAEQLKNSAQMVEVLKAQLDKVGDSADEATLEIINMYSALLKTSGVLSQEDLQEFEQIIQNFNEAANAVDKYRAAKDRASSIKFEGDSESISEDSWQRIEDKAEQNLQEGKSGKELFAKGNNPEYDKQKQNVEELNNFLDETVNNFNSQAEAVKKANAALTEEVETSEELEASIRELVVVAEDFSSHNLLDDTNEQKALDDLIQKMNELEDKGSAAAQELAQELIQAFEVAVQHAKQSTHEMSEALDFAASGKGKGLEEQFRQAKGSVQAEAEKIDMTQTMQSLTDVLGATEMAVFGVTAAWSGLTALWNEDLTLGQRLGQAFTGILTGATMLIPSILQLTAAHEAGTLAKIKDIPATLAAAAAEKVKTAAENGSTIATWLNTAAVKANTAALLKNPYVLVAAAILGLIAVVTGLTKAYEKNNSEVNKAAEAAEAARKEFEETQTAINDISAALDGWKNATDSLDDLEKGTAAWKQQLIEANNYVLKLLDTYPQLAQYISTDEDGLMSISDEGVDMIQEENVRKLEAAQVKQATAQAYYANAKKDATAESLSKTTGGEISEMSAQTIIDYGLENGNSFLSQSYDELEAEFGSEVAGEIVKYSSEIADALSQAAAYATEAELHTDTVVDSMMQGVEGYSEMSSAQQKYARDYIKDSGWDEEFAENYETWEGRTDGRVRRNYRDQIGATEYREKDDGTVEYLVDGVWTAIDDTTARMELASADTQDALGDLSTAAMEAAEQLNKIQTHGKNDETVGKREAMSDNEATAIANGFTTDDEGNKTMDLSNLSDKELDNLLMGTGGKEGNNYEFTLEQAIAAGFSSIEEYINAINKEAHAEKKEREQEVENEGKNAIGEGFDQVNFGEGRDGRRKKAEVTGGLLKTGEKELYDSVDWSGLSEGIEPADIIANMDWENAPADKEGIQAWFKEQAAEGIVEAERNLELEKIGISSEEVEEYAEHLQEIAESSDDVADSLKDNKNVAKEVSARQKKYNVALEDGLKLQEEFGEILDDNNTVHEDWTKAADGFNDVLVKTFNLAEGTDLGQEFLGDPENWDLYKKYLEGDIEAFNELSNRIIASSSDFQGLGEAMQQEVTNGLSAIDAQLAASDFEIGATFDDLGITNEVQGWLNQGVDPLIVEGVLDKKGLDLSYEWVQFPEDTSVVQANGQVTLTWMDKDTGEPITESFPQQYYNDMVKENGGFYKVVGTKSSYSGAPGKGGRSGSKKGKGGGGGGGGSKPKKSVKKSEKKQDRYRTVNNSLKELSTEFERLAEKQDKLFGKDLLDNLNAQLKVLEKQVTTTKTKLKLAQQEAAEMRSQKYREKNYKDDAGYTRYNDLLDYKVKFDANNEITNYDAIIKSYDDKITKKIAEWNAMSAKKQASKTGEKLEAEIEALEANRDTFLELVEEYDTLIYDTIPGLVDEVTQMAYDQIELRFEAFHIEADLRLDLTEAYSDWEDFQTKLAEYTYPNNLYKQTEAILQSVKDIGDSGLGHTLSEDLETYTKVWQDYSKGNFSDDRFLAKDKDGNIQKDASGNVIFDEKALKEALQEDMENAQDYILEQEERFKQIHDNWIESIENVGDAYEEELEALEYIGDQLEHNANLVELINGEDAYSKLSELYASQKQNLENIKTKQISMMNYYKGELEKEIGKGEAADEEAVAKWREMYLDAANQYRETLLETAELVQKDFENSVQMLLDTFDKDIFGEGGSRKVKAQWEIETEQDDKYLDTIEKTFELQKFTNTIKGSIAETDSVSAQKRLNSLLDDQLEKLREKDKLTQYDLDRANALYELELKKIALEEAQNNKSQMRLRRDSSGNFSYQFVSDAESTATAQQELLEAQNNLYSLDKDTMKERNEELWNIYQEYQDLMTEYSQLTVDEREKYQKEYDMRRVAYEQQMVDLGAEVADIQINIAESAASTMSTAYEQAGIDMQTNFDENILPNWTTNMNAMIAKINEGDDSFKNALDKLWLDISEKSQTAATEMQTIASTSEGIFTKANEEAGKWKTATEATTTELKAQVTEMDALNQAAITYKETWDGIKKDVKEALENAQKLVTEQLKIEADNTASGNSQPAAKPAAKPSTPASKPAAKPAATPSVKNYQKGTLTFSGNGSKRVWTDSKGGKYKASSSVGKAIQRAFDKAWSKNGGYKGDYWGGWTRTGGKLKADVLHKKYGLQTGGYTGDWSGIGKLAFLHQKELVLNAKDTENMLAAIKILRKQFNEQELREKEKNSSSIKIKEKAPGLDAQSLANAISIAMGQNLKTILNSYEIKPVNLEGLTKEEKSDIINIEIKADFPNATQSQEIEKAFEQLVNLASQRAYSTKR